MSSLTATNARRSEVLVNTHEFALIMFAIRVSKAVWDAREVYRLSFNAEPPRGWSLAPTLRAQTLEELEALAALERPTAPRHDQQRRRLVSSRIAEDGRLTAMEGTGSASLIYGNGFEITWTPIVTTAEMAVDYALALLLDASRPWGEILFRCFLPECRQFFIAKRTKKKGQFRYKYCCPEHQKAADDATRGERVKRARAKAKAKARKRK